MKILMKINYHIHILTLIFPIILFAIETGNEAIPRREKINWNQRYDTSINYNEGASGIGDFVFNEGDSLAVWYRPLTQCIVRGIEIYLPASTDLVNSEIQINLSFRYVLIVYSVLLFNIFCNLTCSHDAPAPII